MNDDDDNYRINIISHKRPQNILREIYKPIKDKTFYYVGKGESKDYAYYVNNDDTNRIIESGGLIESRNQALNDSWNEDKDAVIVEDDLKSIKCPSSKNFAVNIQLTQALDMLHDALYNITRGICYLAGVAPTPNIFYYNPEQPFKFKHFIVGSMIYVRKGCNLYFDNNLKLKEDYDYTLQHIQKYGGVVRRDDILATFEHYSNKGGAVDIRNNETESESINYLKQKWGREVIRDNPRRKNEILLRVK